MGSHSLWKKVWHPLLLFEARRINSWRMHYLQSWMATSQATHNQPKSKVHQDFFLWEHFFTSRGEEATLWTTNKRILHAHPPRIATIVQRRCVYPYWWYSHVLEVEFYEAGEYHWQEKRGANCEPFHMKVWPPFLLFGAILREHITCKVGWKLHKPHTINQNQKFLKNFFLQSKHLFTSSEEEMTLSKSSKNQALPPTNNQQENTSCVCILWEIYNWG